MNSNDLSIQNNSLLDYLFAEVALTQPKGFGANLRRLRLAAGIRANRLAPLVNVKPPTISNWELRPTLPETPTLLKLAKALNCSVEDLLEGVDAEYDAMARQRRDLIRQSGEQGSTLPEGGSVDVPASGGTDRALVERVEQLEHQLAETTKVAHRLARLLEQSGVPKEGRPPAQSAPGVRRRDRKTG